MNYKNIVKHIVKSTDNLYNTVYYKEDNQYLYVTQGYTMLRVESKYKDEILKYLKYELNANLAENDKIIEFWNKAVNANNEFKFNIPKNLNNEVKKAKEEYKKDNNIKRLSNKYYPIYNFDNKYCLNVNYLSDAITATKAKDFVIKYDNEDEVAVSPSIFKGNEMDYLCLPIRIVKEKPPLGVSICQKK